MTAHAAEKQPPAPPAEIKRKIKIGLIGCGTVGQGLLGILHDKKDFLRDAFGFEGTPIRLKVKHRPRKPRS